MKIFPLVCANCDEPFAFILAEYHSKRALKSSRLNISRECRWFMCIDLERDPEVFPTTTKISTDNGHAMTGTRKGLLPSVVAWYLFDVIWDSGGKISPRTCMEMSSETQTTKLCSKDSLWFLCDKNDTTAPNVENPGVDNNASAANYDQVLFAAMRADAELLRTSTIVQC
jgi:hypothetical protein